MIRSRVHVMMADRGFKTRKALAEASGVSENNLGRLVKGDTSRIDLDTLDKLCRALRCQVGDLFEYVDLIVRTGVVQYADGKFGPDITIEEHGAFGVTTVPLLLHDGLKTFETMNAARDAASPAIIEKHMEQKLGVQAIFKMVHE